MAPALQGIQPPSWLKGVNVISHVKGGIWEIHLTGYGRTLVGPYTELKRYLSVKGLGEDAHHIVGQEHLKVVRTGYTVNNAPSVALERQLHNSQVSVRITAEQKWLGGRGSPRATATRAEIRNIYRSVYTWHTNFRELATISTNVLATQAPIGSAPAPTTSSAVGNPAVENRLGAGAATGNAGRLGASAASIVEGKGGKAVIRLAAVRGAALVVGRVLVAVIIRLIKLLDLVSWITLPFEIMELVYGYFKEEAIKKAIEKAMQTNIPDEIKTALNQNMDEITRYYARAWLNKPIQSAMFLYLSPRMVIEGGATTKDFDFDVHVQVKSIAQDLVSTQFILPDRKDLISIGPSYHKAQIRWSVDQPIYTQFDIYLAFTEFFVEHVVDSWAMHYATGAKLSPATVTLFHAAVDTLAHISATLKYEPWFGYVPYYRSFSSSTAAAERWEALQGLSRKIEKELIPKVSALEAQRLINPETVRWDAYWSPMRGELDPRGEQSLLPAMRRIAIDMKYLDAKYLDYERFETLHARQKGVQRFEARTTFNSIEDQKFIDLREFLKPVQHHLPKSLMPTVGDIFEIPAEFANKLVLELPSQSADE